jgi:putative transposase
MKDHSAAYSVSIMARVLHASRSGYHAWKLRLDSPEKDARLKIEIEALFNMSRQTYGYRRIAKALRNKGEVVNTKKIRRIMEERNLYPKAVRKFKATTQSKHSHPVAENLLDRDFTATAPNQKWSQDITYIWTKEGWLYLAVVIDLFSRMVVGWAMAERMGQELVLNALTMAIWRRKRPRKVMVHSDRGSQYCAKDFQALLSRYDMVCSMSRKGECWDNATTESFFHSLKVEWIYGETIFETRKEAIEKIFDYIESWYNTQRLHSSNGQVSPAEFEKRAVLV